jgi:hypothetical protein
MFRSPVLTWCLHGFICARSFQLPAVRITKRVVDSAPTTTEQYFIWDSVIRGFGLRITPSGVKSYVLQYRLHGGCRVGFAAIHHR